MATTCAVNSKKLHLATTCAVNSKKLHLTVAALCLALVVVVAAAASTPGQAGKEAVKPMCQVPNNVTACVRQIQDLKVKKPAGTKLLEPNCCRQLAEQFGCACVLRDALKDAKLLDLQEPFCVKGSSCE